MSIDLTLEQRIAALEQAVSELRRQSPTAAPVQSWLDRLTGSITDDEAFLKALEYGRAYRNADRPAEEPEETA